MLRLIAICVLTPSAPSASVDLTELELRVYVAGEPLTEVMVTSTCLFQVGVGGSDPNEMLTGSNVAVTKDAALRSIRPPPLARTLLSNATTIVGERIFRLSDLEAEFTSADLTCSGLHEE